MIAWYLCFLEICSAIPTTLHFQSFVSCIYVTVPEKRDLNEANFILRYKPFKNVCHIDTNVKFKLHWTITLDRTGLCSYSKVHFVEQKEKEYISIFIFASLRSLFSGTITYNILCSALVNSYCAHGV